MKHSLKNEHATTRGTTLGTLLPFTSTKNKPSKATIRLYSSNGDQDSRCLYPVISVGFRDDGDHLLLADPGFRQEVPGFQRTRSHDRRGIHSPFLIRHRPLGQPRYPVLFLNQYLGQHHFPFHHNQDLGPLLCQHPFPFRNQDLGPLLNLCQYLCLFLFRYPNLLCRILLSLVQGPPLIHPQRQNPISPFFP